MKIGHRKPINIINIIDKNESISIDWFHQSMKIDTHNANPPQHRGERGKWPNLLLFVGVGTFKKCCSVGQCKTRTADCRLQTADQR